MRFVTLSATSAKTNDVRDVISQAQNEKRLFKRKTILFIDEIHRFNKSQQVSCCVAFLLHPDNSIVLLLRRSGTRMCIECFNAELSSLQ